MQKQTSKGIYMHEKKTENVQKDTLSMEEVAKMLGISVRTAYYGAQQGHFPAFKVMGRWIIPRPAIEKLLRGELEVK